MNLLIFDVDGTLTASTGVDDEAFVAAIRRVMGFTVEDTDWGNYTHSTDHGLTVETSQRYLGVTPTGDQIAAIKRAFVDGLRERIGREGGRCRPVAGVRELLARLRAGETRWHCGIASGAWAECAAVKLQAAGVDVNGLPATYSHADERGRALSREAIISGTIELLSRGAKPERIVYVGDGVWDARAARAMGIGFVGVRVKGDDDRLRAEGATRVVRDFADADRFLALAAS